MELSLYVDNIIQPYAEYSLLMEADGYEPVNISGVEILSGRMSIQDIKLRPLLEGEMVKISLSPHIHFMVNIHLRLQKQK